MATRNLSKIKRERLIAKIRELKESANEETVAILNEVESELNKKKYGLVWEEHSEEVEDAMLTQIPVFTEVVEREITNGLDGDYNFLLEGDNLHSLHLLEKTHQGRIDVIYIDPPYNTGKEFIYDDAKIGLLDGFSHSKWLSFMFKRLQIAKRLLSPKGIIFISIDDHEQAQLKLICDEVFGMENFIAQIIWERAYAPVNLKKHFSESHDYILCYANDFNLAVNNGLIKTAEAKGRYKNPDKDNRGVWKAADATVGPVVKDKVYPIILPSGRIVEPPSGRCWVYTENVFHKMVQDGRIWFGSDGNSVPAVKKFASEVKQTMTPMTIWFYKDVGHSQDATKELKDIFNGEARFSYPKSVRLIKRIVSLYGNKDSIVLDFFAGSGTTAQAVLELNKEDGGNRKFILCTNNENNICENVTYPRVKTVITGERIDGSKYSDGIPANLKYYKTDFIPKTDDGSVPYALLEHVKELIQLELHCKIDNKTICIAFNEDELDSILAKNAETCKKLFLSSDVLLSGKQIQQIEKHNIEVIDIPEYYFSEELREVDEV